MSKDTKVNKLKNEEFKIWKKSVPSLYQHVSFFKPQLDARLGDVLQFEKRFTFNNEVIPDQKRGVLNTGLFYSVGSNIYKLDCSLPLGLQHGGNEQELPDPQYNEVFKQVGGDTFPSPHWILPGETIIKMSPLESGENTLLALTSTASLAWFKEGSRNPTHIMQEIMGPSTSFSSIHSIRNSECLAVCDFDLSRDKKELVKCQADRKEGQSTIKIVDNSDKVGTPLRRFNVEASVIHSVSFLDNNLYVTCSDENVVSFWDKRSDSQLWSFTDSQDGNITSLSSSSQLDGFFATGTDAGVIKLWDLRAIMSQQQEMVSFYHSNEDPVVDLQFSPTNSTEFLSVGKSGNVYQWDTDFFFTNEEVDEEDLHLQCLKFLHTGGSRRSIGANDKRNMVNWHPAIDQLVGTIDNDCSIAAYKAFTGREEEQQDEEDEQE
ncbi:ZYRO0F06776p [Zygosaccharomyces rouxii]|uniref:ZYRO0F06776p n=1 Tax=Zygosaccharomyces rouxii (strain ATCC 2623 / CBS 732 / NBRC 1130 / NCYC 568 / NRRL Y-229) TaxID=559307 RepID=C5DXP8_ZYGRC|nr:uncharacterized protein ZYRO0F06776g [Zygosaccharomyces rouxii]KAH9199318.1 WD40-repeat-containing domain protein [Zygosaccharomyces rouxii]CAR28559.1 ZYRO0F06776p [Zygosaccharomyces rouxii]